MGSAEFEFGAVPDSLIKMIKTSALGKAKIVPIFDVLDGDRSSLLMYGNLNDNVETQNYAEHIKKIACGNVRCLKENPRLHECIQSTDKSAVSKTQKNKFSHREADFWWDIENHVFLSFDMNLMTGIGILLANSHLKMENARRQATKAKEEQTMNNSNDSQPSP